jgi:type VI secretion system secreted protein Hcp
VALYMKFGSIKGDATQEVAGRVLIKDPAFLEEQGWINLSDFKWSIDRGITTRSGSQSNTHHPKQPEIHQITVKKEVDSATAQLLDSICNNNKAEICNIIFVKTGDPGEVYMQYRLSNVFITKFNIDLDADKNPMETMDLTFTKVEMAHLRGGKTNVLSKSEPNRFEFDKQTAAAGNPAASGSKNSQ